MLTIGDKFPSFKLKAAVSLEKGNEFKDVTDADYAGKWKVVFFWPKDFTFVCPTEIAAFGKRDRDFKDRDAQVLGASVDNEFVHVAWRKSHPDLKDLPFPMLADLNRDLSKALGIIHPTEGVSMRATFIVDPEGDHPLRERDRPGRRQKRRRGGARPRRPADRRALPVQLAEGPTDAGGGVVMDATDGATTGAAAATPAGSRLEQLRDALPEPARDIRLNLQSVMAPGALTPEHRWGVAVASAVASRNQRLQEAVVADARTQVDAAVVDDAVAAAVMMAMNNVYYRFRHLVEKPSYMQKPARLRMNRIAKPATRKLEFELLLVGGERDRRLWHLHGSSREGRRRGRADRGSGAGGRPDRRDGQRDGGGAGGGGGAAVN